MLAKRIVPTMLVKGRTLVKGERFNAWRSVGHAAQAARIHAARGVDELCILDISATAENRGPDLGLVSELAEGCFIPITVGGGVRSLKDIDALLRAGADKVAICTGAIEVPELIEQAAARFGRQAIAVVVEADEDWMVSCRCGQKQTAREAIEWVREVAERGAGEILLQSVDRDGVMQGYDLKLIEMASAVVEVPVIASGGCGSYADMLAGIHAGASAVAAGAMFQFTDATPRGAAKFLHAHNVCVRL